MNLENLFDRLWNDYIVQNPSAGKIHKLFINEGENVVNDHIAFRTIDSPEVNVDVLALPFVSRGYVAKGEYYFKEKHLYAKHFELRGDNMAPRIFISQLILSECSAFIQATLNTAIEKAQPITKPDELIFSGSVFKPLSYQVFKQLSEESEYAAWFYVFGYRANHFTISINELKKYDDILKVNNFLRRNGFVLNSSGGEVKGTRSDLLQQSSTLADRVKVMFLEGSYEVPCCYYEFAQRFPDSEGHLYNGFVAKSADRIFESTNFHKNK